MQAQLSNLMYQTLYSHIGEEVSCISLENGNIVEYRGVLKQVLPFNGVMIDEDFVHFESGEHLLQGGSAIREIVTLSDSKTLYFNADTLGYAPGERDEMNYKVK